MKESASLKPRAVDALPHAMPKDIHNVYIYEVFNTASNSVILASPMLLFFQHLNASATLLAFVASLAPFLNILQMPASHFVEQVGYRRFVLGGWTACSAIIVGMAVVAFLPKAIGPNWTITLMVSLVFLYNAFRGISICGIMPWFTHIVPEGRRGEFLAKDQLAGALAAITCLFISGWLLQLHGPRHSFGLVFSLSAATAILSLFFLRRIPDVPVDKIIHQKLRMSWWEMLSYPPFFKYVRYNLITNLALGASGVFVVRFFRTVLDISESGVLFVSCLFTLVLSVGLFLIGPLIDRAGNKPALMFSGIFFIANFVLWGLVAGRIIPYNIVILFLHVLTIGIASALWNLGNTRAIMGIVPAIGRPRFLAFYNVASNIVVGSVPLFWGPILDVLEKWKVVWGLWQWNSYSLFYFVLTLTMILSLIMLRSVAEPTIMTWDVFIKELLVKTPAWAVSRLIGRFRGFLIR